MSPSLADIRMFEIISKILDLFQFKNNITHLSIYRDDGFVLFDSSEDNLMTFFDIANTIHPLIKFTHEISSESIQFLDITVFKGERWEKMQILDVKLYRKPTDNFQYLERTSTHPTSVFKGFITAEIIRFRRSCNNLKDFNKEVQLFKSKLLKRGHYENEIDNIITNTTKRERKQTLKYNYKNKKAAPPLVFATRFNPAFKGIGRALRKHWHLIEQNRNTKTMFPKPPIIAYKRHKNLKEYLTNSKMENSVII
ncbi:unnamed protein product [Mytilus edulis]|uniref:Helix-turn-helix domain-containing protein n=1 Tax=Mytilus edulis TaxID=6550 RepID=A0A8S3UER4_MYTED|nr:unnamed protein product [Mytilus edulis]